MMENKYFQQALSNFAFDAANGGVIRHLAEKGYTVRQIMGQLDVPAPYEKVQREVWNVLVGRGVILLEEPSGHTSVRRERYVEERGRYGKKSFRKITDLEQPCGQVTWMQTEVAGNEDGLQEFLETKRLQNGKETAYLSCDYGIFRERKPERYEKILDILEERQRQYLDGLPWISRRVYHRMDQRMSEIMRRQLCGGLYDGSCYFVNLKEKIIIR